MILKPIEILEQNVPGTSRQTVRAGNGNILQRQNVYLKEEAWDVLRELSKEQGVSGSVVIARLIWQAWRRTPGRRKAPQ